LSALPGNRRDPSGQRPTTASQHGPATVTRIRDANTSAFLCNDEAMEYAVQNYMSLREPT